MMRLRVRLQLRVRHNAVVLGLTTSHHGQGWWPFRSWWCNCCLRGLVSLSSGAVDCGPIQRCTACSSWHSWYTAQPGQSRRLDSLKETLAGNKSGMLVCTRERRRVWVWVWQWVGGWLVYSPLATGPEPASRQILDELITVPRPQLLSPNYQSFLGGQSR